MSLKGINLKEYSEAFALLPSLLSQTTYQGHQSFKLPKVYFESDETFTFSETLFGKQMEELFNQILLRDSASTVLLKNHQLKSNSQTIGEIDFIIEQEGLNALQHIELAVKFYVYPPGLKHYDIHEWIGPNRHDRLTDKLDKLFNKQLPLAKYPMVKEALGLEEEVFQRIESKFCLVGMLFIPEGFQWQDDVLNPESIGGNCYLLQELQEVIKDYNEAYLPQKIEWPLVLENHNQWQPAETVMEEIKNPANKTGSFMLWLKNETSYKRCFILDWTPNLSF